MKGQKVLLIGALGFIGSNIARRLISDGYNVDCYDDLSFGSMENLTPEMKFSKLSFQEIISDRYLDMFDTCVFSACANIIYAQTHPVETFKTNAYDSIQFFKKFKGRIIYTSTASVYGQADIFPTPENADKNLSNAYDQSKMLAELFLEQRGNYTTLRLSNVFGVGQRPSNPYCGVLGKFVEQGLKLEPITIIGDGSQTRDYTYIDDVVNAIILAVEQPAKNDVFNIATGIETSITELANAFPNEKTYVPLRSIDKLTRRCLNIEKAKYELGWSPQVSLAEGLKRTIQWQMEMLRIEAVKDGSILGEISIR